MEFKRLIPVNMQEEPISSQIDFLQQQRAILLKVIQVLESYERKRRRTERGIEA